MQDVLQDVFHDALPMIPFLFLTYLLMEYLEHKSNDRFQKRLESARALGPLIGGILGICLLYTSYTSADEKQGRTK